MLARRFATAVSSAPLRRVAARRALATAAAAERIVFTSPHTSLDIPDKTIWEIAHERATDSGDRNAFICGLEHTKLTFAELHESAGRLALALAQDGVRKGDAVMVHSFNTIEYPIVVLALTALGAVCSPSPPMFLATELARQAKAANANYIITHADLKDVAIEAADKVGIQRKHIYTVGATSVPNLKSVNELIQREMGAFDFEKIDPDSNVLLPFSSGTTGAPKGVALSARNMVANAVQVHHVQDLGDHSLGLLPFYHIYAMMLMHLSIYQGAAKVVLPRFEPHTFLNALSTYKIRAAHVAPPIALFLANHPMVKDYDISATEFLVSGGAPMGKEVENLVKARLGVGVKQAYGMTEASPAVNYTEDAFHKPGSVGRLVPNTELRVRCTATGVDLPANERGELLFRGPQVMLGYLNNPDANKSVFTADRFLCTGDIGYIDDDGFVFVVDRVKELIKYKGHQVAPAELEDILNKHPSVTDSCVIRGRDEFGEELPKAFVVLRDSTNAEGLTDDDVMAFVAENVAAFKKVRQVEFIDAIPKSPTGKILRRQLQEIENNKFAS